MHALNFSRAGVVTGALDAALRAALGNAISGISTGRDTVTVWFYGPPTPAQEAQAQSAVATHDPAFLSSSKTSILNNGSDEATIVVGLPHTSADSIIPEVNGVALPALTVINQQAAFTVSADDSFDDGDTLTIGVQGHPYEPLVIGVQDAD